MREKQLNLEEVSKFETEYVAQIGELIKQMPVSKEAIAGMFAALSNWMVAIGQRAFGKEESPQIISLAINRAIQEFIDKD